MLRDVTCMHVQSNYGFDIELDIDVIFTLYLANGFQNTRLAARGAFSVVDLAQFEKFYILLPFLYIPFKLLITA